MITSRRFVLLAATLLLGAYKSHPSAPPPPASSAAASIAPPASASAPAASAPLDISAIGTPHPVVFQAASPDGRWVVICQAREDTNGDGKIRVEIGRHGEPRGDEVTPYLIQGTGPGEALDELVALAEGGRHLVFVQAGRLVLFDSVAKTRVDLTAAGGTVDPLMQVSPPPPPWAFTGRGSL